MFLTALFFHQEIFITVGLSKVQSLNKVYEEQKLIMCSGPEETFPECYRYNLPSSKTAYLAWTILCIVPL